MLKPHTCDPLPYRVKDGDIVDAHGVWLSGQPPTLEFIGHACNLHERLMTQLEKLLSCFVTEIGDPFTGSDYDLAAETRVPINEAKGGDA